MFDDPVDGDLDDAQRAAALHGDGPLIVLAGAGTGKTRTLVSRVVQLLARGVRPERILLLTFTRRAAEDMLARAGALVGDGGTAKRLCGGTFHAIAHQVLRAWSSPLGLGEEFSVIDPADVTDVLDLLRHRHNLHGAAQRFPKPATLADLYSRSVNTGRSLGEVLAVDFPWCAPHKGEIAKLFRDYVAHKRAHALVDFDDLLLYWRAALRAPHLGEQLAGAFDHVLVDEYQDVNALQVDIVLALRPGGRGLTVVGDDAQAIYGFRGASAGHLHELAARLPGAHVVALEANFRSTAAILHLANRVRPPATGAPGAGPPAPTLTLRAARQGGRRPVLTRCYDAASEARVVVTHILERHENGVRLRDQAVLVRAAHHADLIELELTARRVPYRKYGGLRFLEAAHVKDFLAAARVTENPADDLAWFRLLRLHEGIGPARARALLENLPARRGVPASADADALAVAAAPASARVQLQATLAGLRHARDAAGTQVRAEAVAALVTPLVSARYPDAATRVADLERLVAAAAASADFASWLAQVTLDPPASTSAPAGPPELDDDWVTVSTVHSAKGLEWPVVHLAHLVDGAFPSDMALRAPSGLAEEQRLFYVAVTRARDELLLTCPLRMPHHRYSALDRHSLALESRLLTGSARETLRIEEEARVTGSPRGVELDEATLPDVRAAVGAAVSLEDLWR